MTLEVVQSRLDKLLGMEAPKVAMLTGDWGAGKTYQWKQAIERAAKKGVFPRYAYVSLFGINSLAEVRKRIVEETISAVRIPGRGTLGEEFEGQAIGLKPMQIMKLLPMIPYLGRLDLLAQELSFATVRNAVICIDDIERAPKSLHIADVLGFASFLKEERHCRILLISNQKRLGDDAKEELAKYFEKVVEEIVDFAPTPEEACVVALGDELDGARQILAERLTRLGVSNIRVISRLGALADELALVVKGLHSGVLVDVINTLALFGVAHFIPHEEFPTAEYLLGYGSLNWSKYLKVANKGEQTEQEKRELEWDNFIADYGYQATSALGKEIYAGIAAGFFREEVVRKFSEDLSSEIEEGGRVRAFRDALRQFWWGVGESRVVFERLLIATEAALGLVSASEVYPVYQILLDIERRDAAMKLLGDFIAANQDRRNSLVLSEEFGANYDATFKAMLEAEVARFEESVSLEKVLDGIDFRRGWSPEDLVKVAEADFDAIVHLLTSAKDTTLFTSRLTTLLKFGEKGGTEDQKSVRDKTIAWLKTIAAADPISALRVNRFLPADIPPPEPACPA